MVEMPTNNTHTHIYPLAIQAETMADLIAEYEENNWHYQVVPIADGHAIAAYDAEDRFLGYL